MRRCLLALYALGATLASASYIGADDLYEAHIAKRTTRRLARRAQPSVIIMPNTGREIVYSNAVVCPLRTGISLASYNVDLGTPADGVEDLYLYCKVRDHGHCWGAPRSRAQYNDGVRDPLWARTLSDL